MGRTLLLFWTIWGAGCFGVGNLIAEGDQAEVTRVKIEQYLASKPVRTEDPMIRFERRYLSWGAIDREEYQEREGQYFTVFWRLKDSRLGAVVRLEYLQAKTGPEVHIQEIAVDQPRRGNNVVDFQVTGPDFRKNGAVVAWKASILREGAVLADKRSFLWEDF